MRSFSVYPADKLTWHQDGEEGGSECKLCTYEQKHNQNSSFFVGWRETQHLSTIHHWENKRIVTTAQSGSR